MVVVVVVVLVAIVDGGDDPISLISILQEPRNLSYYTPYIK